MIAETQKASEPRRSPDHLEIHRLAFDQGVKGLGNQDDTIASIRQRAAAIATLSAATAAFLGREAFARSGLPNHPLEVWQRIGVWAALSALCFSAVCMVQLLRPRKGWIFHFTPSRIIDQFAQGEHAADLSRTYEVLARFAEENYLSNERILSKLFRWLWASFITLILQVAAWLLVIA
jgi:hypothetical protein